MPRARAILLLFLGVSGHVSRAMAQSPGAFTEAGNMTTARSQHTATLLADGRVLLAGGHSGPTLASAELYDPATGTFTATGNMTEARVDHTATLLADGRVLIMGNSNIHRNSSAEVYDPVTGMFTAAGPMSTHGCAAALLGTGKVLIVDDPPPYGSSPMAELYDPDTGTFSPTGTYASLDIARIDHAVEASFGGWDCRRATLLADGKVLVAGGIAAELYDPGTGTFSLTGTLTTYPNGFTTTLPQWYDPSKATLLLNGMVLFDGGDGDIGPAYEAWLYNPATGTFSATGRMATPRVWHTQTLLPDGTVLAAGSYETGGHLLPNPGAFGTAELYDAAAGAFSSTPDLTIPRFSHTATLLTNGYVLIAGGTTGAYINPGYSYAFSTELYTPARLVPAAALLSLSGQGQGAILHADTHQVVSSSNPAVAGEALEIYGTGLIEGSVTCGSTRLTEASGGSLASAVAQVSDAVQPSSLLASRGSK